MWWKRRKEVTIDRGKPRIFYHVYEFTKFKGRNQKFSNYLR